jgi:hypothetical protein
VSTALSVRDARAQLVHATVLKNPHAIQVVEDIRPHFAMWRDEILELAIADCVDDGRLTEDAHGRLHAEVRP